jgi:general secretion pathway protein F
MSSPRQSASIMNVAFDLIVRSPQGSVQTLHGSAADAAGASAQLSARGFQVLSCTPAAAPWRPQFARGSGTAARFDMTSLAQELALLIGAGLSVIEALRTLQARELGPTRKAILGDIQRHVAEGLPLSAAFARHPQQFPPLLVATVSASEQTGDLGIALQRYAQHQNSVRQLSDKVLGAAVYPMLLLAVGGLVVMFLLGVVVPRFATLIESAQREMPWSSQLLMAWGRMVAAHPMPLAIGAAAMLGFAAWGVRRLRRSGARSAWIDRLPVIGRIVRQFRHAQLYRTTGMLIQGGIAAPRALQLASDLLGAADRARLQQALVLIHEGRSASDALSICGLADPVAVSMLAVAERSGALADILERIAQFHEAGVARAIDLTSRLFEPALMVLIGLVIGAIVVLMYLPIFDLASSLQ